MHIEGVEQEVIEQICDDDGGWSLARLRALIRGLGRDDDLRVLGGMWRGGHIAFADAGGARCEAWQIEAFLRAPDDEPAWFVQATDEGVRWAYPR